MKKAIALFLSLALILTAATMAAAEGFDLSGLSWQELIDLKNQITLEQFNRDDWQEVEVPAGVWKVGEDIPAEKWVISCKSASYIMVVICEDLDATGMSHGKGNWEYFFIYNPDHRNYSEGDMTSYTITLTAGTYVIVDNGSATFTAPTGTPFTFK